MYNCIATPRLVPALLGRAVAVRPVLGVPPLERRCVELPNDGADDPLAHAPPGFKRGAPGARKEGICAPT